MSKGEDVVLLDFWASPFCMRVKIALAEKGVSYEAREEDLIGGKSELLLKSNPIYQKVPVFLHNEMPLCESTVIVSYIDETWASPPLLPPCPYGRAQARFWADYIDKKVQFQSRPLMHFVSLKFINDKFGMFIVQLFDAVRDVVLSKGEATEAAKKELIEILKVLEGALGETDFFVGKAFGFADILAIAVSSWFLAAEKLGNFQVEAEFPKISGWMKRCMQKESVAKIIPDPEKILEFALMMRKMHGIDH